MSPSEEFITLVVKMREAQRDYKEQATRGNLAVQVKTETKVDEWIQRHIAERVQLDLWTRSVKSSELAGVYNLTDEEDAEQIGGS